LNGAGAKHDPSPITEKHDPYLALRSANYRRFAGGWIFATLGLQMLGMALGWEVWRRTQSPMALGYIGLARVGPVLLMALPAGHAADLYNRKTILILTQVGFVLTASLLALASFLQWPVWTFYVILVLMGTVRSFNGPSRSSLLPLIVSPKAFPNAVAWNSGVFQFSAVAGPLLAGSMIKLSGHITGQESAWPVYLATALGCAIFAASATGIQAPALAQDRRPSSGPDVRCAKCGYSLSGLNDSVPCPECGASERVVLPPKENRFTIRAMLAGMGFVYREKTILAALTLDLVAVILGGATALLPVYADQVLGIGPVGLGWLNAGPFIGAFFMSLAVAHRPPLERAGRALLWSVAGYGVCTILFGLSANIWLSMSMLILLGALDTVSVVVRHVLVQTRTPDELRGRVSAVNSLFIESSNELGKFESGAVAKLCQALGMGIAGAAVVSVVSGGIGTVLVVAAVAAAWPQIRKLGRL
jgi:MFS family permease